MLCAWTRSWGIINQMHNSSRNGTNGCRKTGLLRVLMGRFSPTFTGDIAREIYLGCKNGLSGVYNLANPEFFLRDELARQFSLALGEEAQIISKPQSKFNFVEPRPLKSYLDSSRFVKATGMYFTTMREVFNTFKNRLT